MRPQKVLALAILGPPPPKYRGAAAVAVDVSKALGYFQPSLVHKRLRTWLSFFQIECPSFPCHQSTQCFVSHPICIAIIYYILVISFGLFFSVIFAFVWDFVGANSQIKLVVIIKGFNRSWLSCKTKYKTILNKYKAERGLMQFQGPIKKIINGLLRWTYGMATGQVSTIRSLPVLQNLRQKMLFHLHQLLQLLL